MRISDWSSDVCSSDLDAGRVRAGADDEPAHDPDELRRRGAGGQLPVPEALHLPAAGVPGDGVRLGHPDGVCGSARHGAAEIGRANVYTPVTLAPLVFRLLLVQKHQIPHISLTAQHITH